MSWVRFPGQTLVTVNVWGKSCTGGITLTNVLDLSVLHSYLNQINNKTLTPNPKSGCLTLQKLTLSGPCPSELQNER